MHHNKQRGIIATIFAVVQLILMTTLMLVLADTVFMQIKLTSNDRQVKEAFEAAESGINIGIQHLLVNQSAIVVDSNSDGDIDTYSDVAISNVTQADNTEFDVSYSTPINGTLTTINIQSIGTSSDGTATRTINQILVLNSILAGIPPAPVVAKSTVNFSGNLTITNMESDFTIWSGDNIAMSGSATTATSGGATSNSTGNDVDVVTNDATLSTITSDQFFEGFFSQSKTDVYASADMAYSNTVNTNYSSDLNNVTEKLIWIDQAAGTEAQINSNITIGSAAEPVIMVVNGDLTVNGNATIYGVLYVIGDWNNTGGGTLDVYGSVIIEGATSGNGTPNVVYDSSVLNNAATQNSVVAILAGSWRDF